MDAWMVISACGCLMAGSGSSTEGFEPINPGMRQREQSSAKELAFVYIGVWAAGGTMLAAALANGTPEVQLAGVATCGLIAAVIGWSVSQSRRSSHRLQAITARRKTDTP
jgi:hypothetical protein